MKAEGLNLKRALSLASQIQLVPGASVILLVEPSTFPEVPRLALHA